MLQDISTLLTLVLSVLSAITVLIVVIVKVIRNQSVSIDIDHDGKSDFTINGSTPEEENHRKDG